MFDLYEEKTIKAHPQHQQQIYLNLRNLQNHNEYLKNLFMEDLKRYDAWKEEYIHDFNYFDCSMKENMFKQSLLKIYKNIKTIIIETTFAYVQYPISLSYILLIMKQHQNIQKFIIKANRCYYTNNWITLIWNKYAIDLIEMYKKQGINIKHQIIKEGALIKDGEDGYNDYLIIVR